MRPELTPRQRAEHAAEWRWWRKRNPAGARRAWSEMRDWHQRRHLDMRPLAGLDLHPTTDRAVSEFTSHKKIVASR